MVAIRPIRGRVVSSEWLNRVPSPAYDSLTTTQRREYRTNNPWSYLNVTRTPEDEAPGEANDTAALVAKARQALDALLAEGAFDASAGDSMFLYRLRSGDHQQTGIVAEVAVADYEAGRILVHEQIREARAELLAEHMLGVGHVSSPIALTFESTSDIRRLIATASELEPLLDWDDGTLHQTVWLLPDDVVAQLQAQLSATPAYIIDGHHRAAAALTARGRSPQSATTDHMLAALFPDEALQLLGFNRWVQGVDDRDVGKVMDNLRERYVVTPMRGEVKPERGTLAVFAERSWHLVRLGDPARTDPLSTLDPVRLQDEILAPMLGITAPGTDWRLVTISGDQPVSGLESAVLTHGGMAFVVPPLDIHDLFAVANAGQTMPPKSTYFVPKVRSGIFLRAME